MRTIFSLMAIGILILCLSNASPVIAVDYPTRAITIINPMAPGGSHDLMVRTFAPFAEKELGQPVIVVNKPGATGMIGGVAAAQADPDGYTLGMGSTAMTLTIEWEIANGRKPPMTRQDFIPIGTLNVSPTLVVVPYNSPWKTLSDLIRDCKVKPNHYAFGSGGLYGESHIPCVLLMKATGIKCRHVPFKGGGPTLTALVGGHIDFATQFPSTSIPLARGNKIRILATQGDKRSRFVPDIPTVKELGVDAEWAAWVGLVAPKKTPMPIVQKLREVMTKVINGKPFMEAIEKLGDDVIFINGVDLAKYWDSESEKLAKLMVEFAKEEKATTPTK